MGYDSTLNDKVISGAISKLISNIIENLTEKPWRTFILDYTDGILTIAGGDSQGINVGDVFGLYQKGRTVYNKQLGNKIELPGKLVGNIEVIGTAGSTINNEITYPFLCFLLTGGHTQIYLIKSINNYELLGETLDDAVGEAFDKVSKLLGMGYPGGPEIEKASKLGGDNCIELPHPLKNSKDLNFSFSGIKTAISLIVKKKKAIDNSFKCNISNSFQKTISEILEKKFLLSLKYLKDRKVNISQIALVGGVAANNYIYNNIKKHSLIHNIKVILPPKKMLSDNAAMIGWACIKKIGIKKINNLYFKENPRLTLNE